MFEVLADKNNFPLNLKFGRPTITTNEKIVLASIFYPLFALAVQLSPEQVSLVLPLAHSMILGILHLDLGHSGGFPGSIAFWINAFLDLWLSGYLEFWPCWFTQSMTILMALWFSL